ncbi:hypothetical protein [[Mycoplasma] gypis]|uniref:Uncharacterized protein n=1 Tax=[Mycoplasma] gypis TaxID=92404 RepID=A0ABZ2RNH9_9BACT|nr:hypothetical protein [[Mycoplasma] gypis]MBN0919418.1 hypothetical protein [[Mycoplasma] gypis]
MQSFEINERLQIIKANFKVKNSQGRNDDEVILNVAFAPNNFEQYLKNSLDFQSLYNDILSTQTNERNHTSESNIWLKMKIKNESHNQTNYLAQDWQKVFNNIFELPSKNNFSLKINKEKTTFNNLQGWVRLNLEIYHKDKLIKNTANRFFIYLNYFKPFTKEDIKPINNNEWFTDDDFNYQTKNDSEKQIQELVSKINGSNFDYRLSKGKK